MGFALRLALSPACNTPHLQNVVRSIEAALRRHPESPNSKNPTIEQLFPGLCSIQAHALRVQAVGISGLTPPRLVGKVWLMLSI